MTPAEITTIGVAITDKKYRDATTVAAGNNCGVNGSGVFSVTTEATAAVGVGTAAAACRAANTTTITENGVIFNAGC